MFVTCINGEVSKSCVLGHVRHYIVCSEAFQRLFGCINTSLEPQRFMERKYSVCHILLNQLRLLQQTRFKEIVVLIQPVSQPRGLSFRQAAKEDVRGLKLFWGLVVTGKATQFSKNLFCLQNSNASFKECFLFFHLTCFWFHLKSGMRTKPSMESGFS